MAFIYIKRPYYSVGRLLCMAAFLFEVQQKNRLEQRGLLRRFSIECIGHQETVEEMRANKSEKYKELKGKQGTPEYDEYFMRYRPNDPKKPISNKSKSNKSNKREREKKQTKTKKTNRMGIRSGKNFSRFFK